MAESTGVFPYRYPIATAARKCQERYPGFRVIGRIPGFLFPQKEVYTMWYAYFRWFDDIVDSVKLGQGDVGFIVDRQRRFLAQLYSGEVPEELSTEELFLAHVVAFDQREGKNFRRDLETLMDTLAFDAERRGRTISAQEFAWYVNANSIPYTNCSLGIFGLGDSLREKLYPIAHAGFLIDAAWDLRSDVALGYMNIPHEDIERYRIDLKQLDSPPVREWVRDTITPAAEEMRAQTPALRSFPLLPRTIAYAMVWHRQRKVARLEARGYAVP